MTTSGADGRGREAWSLAVMSAVVVGGMIGTALRLAVDLALPHEPNEFALATLIVNVVGSGALGWAVAALWPRTPDQLRAGLGVGVLGSFTTFSAVAVSAVALGADGSLLLAALTIALNLGLGLGAAAAGVMLGSAAARRGVAS